MVERLSLPGFVNAHSHAFQRALRGRVEGGDFWAWRDDDARRGAAGSLPTAFDRSTLRPTARCLRAGYTAVGEFHYLGVAEAFAAATRPRGEVDIGIVLLHVAYARGRHRPLPPGIGGRIPRRGREPADGRDRGRRRPPLRAGVPARLARGDRALRDGGRPRAPRPRRRAAPRDRGVRRRARRAPVELLGANGLPRPANDDRARDTRERRRARPDRRGRALGSASARRPRRTSATAFAPVERITERGIGICIGTDSNVRIDPLEELRELEGIARRQSGRRNVFAVDSLLAFGSEDGAAALGLDAWPETAVEVSHPTRRRRRRRSALVAGCSADVFRIPA